MRIVLFVPDNHFYANKIIKVILRKEFNIIAIVVSKRIVHDKSSIASLFYYSKVAGLYCVSCQIIKVLFFQFGSFLYSIYPFSTHDNALLSYKALALKKNIPILHEKDINNIDFIKAISTMRPNLFVSILFNQIFQQSILSLPSLGTINVHPSMLPYYRGMSPTFWVLANGESKTGVTIHTIENREIDRGKIIAQKEIEIMPDDTEHTLYWRCTNQAIVLLVKAFDDIERNTIRYTKMGGIGSYFSIPTKQAVRQFRKRGKRFFFLRQLFSDC